MLNRREMLSGLAMGTLATLAPGCLTAKRDGERRTLRIAHCGDPQFGFSNPGDAAASYAADRTRFERLIDDVNEWRPDLCFLAGDMTHRAVDMRNRHNSKRPTRSHRRSGARTAPCPRHSSPPRRPDC